MTPNNKNMQLICPPTEREVIEREVYGMLASGTLSNVARLLHKDQSQVSRAFNPYEADRKNPVYEYLIHLWAFDGTQAGLSDTLQQLVRRERDKWECFPKVQGSKARLSAAIGHQLADFTEAQLDGKSLDTQIAELEDVIVAAEQMKQRLIAERNMGYAEAA